MILKTEVSLVGESHLAQHTHISVFKCQESMERQMCETEDNISSSADVTMRRACNTTSVSHLGQCIGYLLLCLQEAGQVVRVEVVFVIAVGEHEEVQVPAG